MNLTDVSKRLDVIQDSMVVVDRKFESFISKLLEAEKKKSKIKELGLSDWWTKHELN